MQQYKNKHNQSDLKYENKCLNDLVEIWERLYDRFKSEIDQAVLQGKESLELEFNAIDMIDQDMMELFLYQPFLVLCAAEKALQGVVKSADENTIRNIRFKDLPKWTYKKIRDLRARDLGNIVAVQGMVKKITEVRPKIEDAYFKCLRCGAIIHVPQDGTILKEPMECPKDQGGCGRRSSFQLITEESSFTDGQKMEIQERPEGLVGGEQPRKIEIYLEGDLVETAYPGDIVTVVGVVQGSQRYAKGGKSTEFKLVLYAHNVIPTVRAFEEVKIDKDDERYIKNIASSPDIYKKLQNSIAPTVYGMETEKDAIVLQLFGGTEKIMPDGTRIRGDVHLLFIGDPGTAKSQLLRYAKKIAPRGIYTDGKGSSAAGLTASAVRDEFGEGRWTLEAGALVLADRGLVCIDELDKMNSRDRDALHGAMEQQEINVAKAGINATLKSRCALLAAANPKFGRYDELAPIVDQINLPPALLSRFDLIFPITDTIDEDRDRNLTRHICKAHQAGQLHAQQQIKSDVDHEYEDVDVSLIPTFDEEMLRKYIAYAKREISPVMTQEAMETIEEFYVGIRKQGKNKNTIPITPRQNEAIIRLAEASARVRLDDKVRKEDAERATNILMECLKKVSMDQETGELDIDMVATGVSHSQQDKIKIMNTLIREINSEEGGDGAPRDTVLERAEERGIDREEAEKLLDRMGAMGMIYRPRQGKLGLTNE